MTTLLFIVFIVQNTSANPPKDVAIKLESEAARIKLLEHEIKIYTALKGTSKLKFVFSHVSEFIPFTTLTLSDGIPRVHDIDEGNGYNFIVMDLISESFKTILAKPRFKGRFPGEAIAVFAIQALEILKDIHCKNATHGDVKIDNFAVDSTGKKVILFGKFTHN